MAPHDPNNPFLVVAVFDPVAGMVSINGEAWTRFRVRHKAKVRPAPAPQTTPEPTKKPAESFPPPAEGDDTLACLLCDFHGTCHLHIWTGSRWRCLGSDCEGPFCSNQ